MLNTVSLNQVNTFLAEQWGNVTTKAGQLYQLMPSQAALAQKTQAIFDAVIQSYKSASQALAGFLGNSPLTSVVVTLGVIGALTYFVLQMISYQKSSAPVVSVETEKKATPVLDSELQTTVSV